MTLVKVVGYNFGMVSDFPVFKNLELADKAELEHLISAYEPYSDFNFTSLWAWNTNDELKIASLNGNLVIEMPDYTSDKMVLSVLGSHHMDDTLKKLLIYAHDRNFEPRLKLVPEETVQSIVDKDLFNIIEDPDNHDYVLLVDELAQFVGKKYYDKRNLVNRFNKTHPDHQFVDLDLNNESVHIEINHIFDVWAKHSAQSEEESSNERIAIDRLLKASRLLGVRGLGCYVDSELIGFTFYETSHNSFGFISFEKADRQFPGLYAALNHETAKRLKDLDCKFINFEQDLGIPGLKQAKKLWRPVKFLNKYTVSLK